MKKKVHPMAYEMRDRYKGDVKAGHSDAAEYWRGQAAALFTDANPISFRTTTCVNCGYKPVAINKLGKGTCSNCGAHIVWRDDNPFQATTGLITCHHRHKTRRSALECLENKKIYGIGSSGKSQAFWSKYGVVGAISNPKKRCPRCDSSETRPITGSPSLYRKNSGHWYVCTNCYHRFTQTYHSQKNPTGEFGRMFPNEYDKASRGLMVSVPFVAGLTVPDNISTFVRVVCSPIPEGTPKLPEPKLYSKLDRERLMKVGGTYIDEQGNRYRIYKREQMHPDEAIFKYQTARDLDFSYGFARNMRYKSYGVLDEILERKGDKYGFPRYSELHPEEYTKGRENPKLF